jgi:large subunit ribosomal protein L10
MASIEAQGVKTEKISAIREEFAKASSAVLLDFTGLDMASETQLRVAFRKAGITYKVLKNTLVRRAVAGTPLDGEAFFQHLAGPTGIAWSGEDPSAAAKVVKEFRKDEVRAQRLRVKCGVLEGTVMAGARVETEMASMPGKDEARAMLLAQLLAPMQKLVMQLNAAGQQLALVLDARARQLGG